MTVHRRHDIPVILAFVLCVVAFGSFRSDYRLRANMPTEFFDAAQLPANKRASEEKIARGYWTCAVTQIQWKYGYAHRLPFDPPEEFALAADAGPGTKDSAARLHYWQRLRVIWDTSGIWEHQYEFNPLVFKQSVESAGQWLENLMRRITGYS
ncbi:MAG TPA: hypothetical protein VK812_03130 [Candidatus Binatus sp.]|jgi:hypothetical protein|nr:hypothetical protein [Candidatus Binatus sp.]HWY22008.1 hypothetical protein [Candidatus Acidoferrum sp.]